MPQWDFWERRRLALLEALAYAADCPFHSVIGAGSGRELLALAKGVRRPHPLREGSAAGSVVCFHWGYGARAAKRYLTEYAEQERRCRRRARGPTAVDSVVRFVESDRATRAGWEADVAQLLRGGPERFGLVCHLGVGQPHEIRADLDTMLPMMSDRTEIVLCGMGKKAPQDTFRSFVRDGFWSGVLRSSIGLAVLGLLPFPAR